MLKDKLKAYSLTLASASPRRQFLLKELDVDFRVEVRSIDEAYPSGLNPSEITVYLSQLKASAFADLTERSEERRVGKECRFRWYVYCINKDEDICWWV